MNCPGEHRSGNILVLTRRFFVLAIGSTHLEGMDIMMKRKLLMMIVIISLLLSACQPSLTQKATPVSTLESTQVVALDYAPAPADNPLKGFMPFYDAYSSRFNPIANDFPHSMEWFYVPLRNLMNGPDSFTFDTGLEPQLDSIAGRGHQAVFRVYLDYPGRFSGIPRFLLDGGIKVRPYTFFGNTPGASVSPDYDDPKLVNALENFVKVLGERYDGDPRIAFITLGLIGFWGEWHTWPMDGFTQETSLLKARPNPTEENWMPSDANQLRILKAFDASFNTTRLVMRYPMIKPASQDAEPGRRIPYISTTLNIGYHDDSFAYETMYGNDWYFMGKMEWRGALDKWMTEPIVGELRPEIQLGIWLDSPRPDTEDFSAAVDGTHASWLIAHSIFISSTMKPGNDIYARALAGAQRLGYEFYVSGVGLSDIRVSGPFQVDVRLQNTGVAPFYYNWPVQLGVLNTSKQLTATWDTPWRIDQIEPLAVDRSKQYTIWSFTQTSHGLQPGAYTLVIHVVNPLSNGKALKFANTTQDQDLEGWLTLGTFTVK